jgi:hypothetical protein
MKGAVVPPYKAKLRGSTAGEAPSGILNTRYSWIPLENPVKHGFISSLSAAC